VGPFVESFAPSDVPVTSTVAAPRGFILSIAASSFAKMDGAKAVKTRANRTSAWFRFIMVIFRCYLDRMVEHQSEMRDGWLPAQTDPGYQ
jgi:hypothetical protein